MSVNGRRIGSLTVALAYPLAMVTKIKDGPEVLKYALEPEVEASQNELK